MKNPADIAYLLLILVLPVSAVAARRLPIGTTVKMALVWLAVFVALFAAVRAWQGA